MTTKADRAKNLRYKRPALASLGLDIITTELAEISEACSEIQWFIDGDDETLLNALDDDEEDEYEFRMAFSDLSSKAEELNNTFSDTNCRIFRRCMWDDRDRYKTWALRVEED